MSKILDGKKVRDELATALTAKIKLLNPKPKLVIIQVGNQPESNIYIKQKIKWGEKIGVKVEHRKFPENTEQEEIQQTIIGLNNDPETHGLIVQLPLPPQLNREEIIETIAPVKDVDGLTSQNVKALWLNSGKGIMPATARGVLSLLSFYDISLTGKHVVVIGRSTLVGKPLAMALLNENATVTIAHRQSQELEKLTQAADIIVTAAGSPGLISAKHLQGDQIIIDVGITSTKNGELAGDVDPESAQKLSQAFSPVPGGIGPMTVISLFENLLQAYEKQLG